MLPEVFKWLGEALFWSGLVFKVYCLCMLVFRPKKLPRPWPPSLPEDDQLLEKAKFGLNLPRLLLSPNLWSPILCGSTLPWSPCADPVATGGSLSRAAPLKWVFGPNPRLAFIEDNNSTSPELSSIVKCSEELLI